MRLKEFSPMRVLRLSQADERVNSIKVEPRFPLTPRIVGSPPRVELPSTSLLDAIVRDSTGNRILANEPDIAKIWKVRLQALRHGRGGGIAMRRLNALDLMDEIQEMLPVDLCANHAIGGSRGGDDPV